MVNPWLMFAFPVVLSIGVLLIPVVPDYSGRYVVPVFVVVAASFSVGLIALTATIRRRGLLSTGQGWIVFLAGIVFAAAEAIPSGWGLYVVAAAAWVVFWPVAGSMRTT